MLPLKEDDTYAVLSNQGMVGEHGEGFYRHDTRYLSRYRWNLPGFRLLVSETPRPDHLVQHWGLIVGPDQKVGLRRELVMVRGGFREKLQFENTSLEPHTLELSLDAAADFMDLFEARGWRTVTRKVEGFSYTAEDDLEVATWLETQPPAPERKWRLELQPREKAEITVEARFESPFDPHGTALPSYEEWAKRFPLHLSSGCSQRVLEQAITDLRALLFSLPEGLYPAAGIPWYVCPFGRDALLTAYMMLPWGAEVAKGVLAYLAKYQGKEVDPFRDEAPGKILHEVRLGELSRTGKLPFSRYYGTVDATPLFVILLERYWHDTGDLEFVRQLKPNWEAALSWMTTYADPDGDGLLEFSPNEKGLTVQSWKDSHDSQSHKDGSLAKGALTVSEVQGYAYAAYRAAAGFYRALGQPEQAPHWEAKAEQIKELFHQKFWLPDLRTYALALDGEKKPLEVLSSNPGHLLWSGIVPPEVASKLVQTMFSEALWSGWGLRTLGAGEVRYNPLSYHNGSVWPHDTAIFAGGLARYGFHQEAQKVAEALFRLAFTQHDLRLPELVGGYEKHEGEPPVPYPAACRPQAWDAAAVVYLLRVVWGMEPEVKAEPPKEGLLSPA
ncbi:MAG TPA: glycogen debranching N-terminal domain-containing protein [Meiothermus sp.]|nr:glycogen debranching N-terminal domain-containing protein [Meiothermus sp.]